MSAVCHPAGLVQVLCTCFNKLKKKNSEVRSCRATCFCTTRLRQIDTKHSVVVAPILQHGSIKVNNTTFRASSTSPTGTGGQEVLLARWLREHRHCLPTVQSRSRGQRLLCSKQDTAGHLFVFGLVHGPGPRLYRTHLRKWMHRSDWKRQKMPTGLSRYGMNHPLRCLSFYADQISHVTGKAGPSVSSYNVLQCNKLAQYCCRSYSDTSNCCSNTSVQLNGDIGTLSLPPVETKTLTVLSGASTTATLACNQDPRIQNATTGSECPKSNTAVVGGAVGGVLGAALLAALGTIAFMCRRSPRKDAQEAPYVPSPKSDQPSNTHSDLSYGSNTAPQELPMASSRPVYEMRGS
jgi:hypothetical protein